MKKIISLLLALTCIFAFVSCGEETAADKFVKIVNSSEPTRIITNTSYDDGENKFVGRYETTLYGSDFEFSYSYQQYADPTTSANPDEYIQTVSGKVYYNDGLYSVDGVNWGAVSPDAAAMQVKFVLDAENLGDYEISTDGKTLETVVTAEQAEAILGIKLNATEDGVSIVITHDGKNLRGITVSYATEYAEVVSLDTSYSYNAVVSPFEEAPQE